VKLIAHLYLIPRSRNMKLYLHFSIRLHGTVINELSIGTILPFAFAYRPTYIDANYSDDRPQDISSLIITNILDVLAACGLRYYQ
jgi:hypothetical protein